MVREQGAVAAAWSPDGQILAVADTAGVSFFARQPLPQPFEEQRRLEIEGGVTALAFGPGGQLLAVGLESNVVQLWEVQTGQLRRTLEGPNRPDPAHVDEPASARLETVAFSPAGPILASLSRDGRVRAWQYSLLQSAAAPPEAPPAGGEHKSSGWSLLWFGR